MLRFLAILAVVLGIVGSAPMGNRSKRKARRGGRKINKAKKLVNCIYCGMPAGSKEPHHRDSTHRCARPRSAVVLRPPRRAFASPWNSTDLLCE